MCMCASVPFFHLKNSNQNELKIIIKLLIRRGAMIVGNAVNAVRGMFLDSSLTLFVFICPI